MALRFWLTSSILLFAIGVPYTAHAKFKVVTTFTIIQDIAQNVAGTNADVLSITKAGAEIHDYQPTPKDIVKAQAADLILWNGLNLERWFKQFFSNMPTKPSVVVTEGIEPISIYAGPYQGKPNPHAWMSTQNALIYIENIRKALVKYDPQNAASYNRNAKNYALQISQLEQTIKQSFTTLPVSQKWLATSEGAFSYLARDLAFNETYLWPINADRQGTPKQVKRLIETIRQHHIPVIFSESTISDRAAKQVARETGIHYGGVLYVDSLSEKGGPVANYIDLLRVTTSTIKRGFDL
ncbi:MULTISPECIES: metal ABC transporter substrate-binding protein [unclassified Agarivorans]|uniref:metal ABC transporter substrate-binding protein n=1 Tax=unclassified Agarivorans TaxID=2636026 RepID=UPI003D7C4629